MCMGYIYKVINTINEDFYIGQTRSKPLKRLYQHKADAKKALKNGYNTSKFHNAMNFYGKENFTIVVIEEVINDELDTREVYWISELKPKYNIYPGGRSRGEYKGRVSTDAMKQATIDALSIKTFQYSLEGLFIKEWKTSREAADWLGHRKYIKNINATMNNKQPTTGGYMWFKEYQGEIIQPFISNRGGIRKVAQYTMSGELIKVWNSMSESKKDGFATSAITMCCKGVRNHHKNYIWKYYE